MNAPVLESLNSVQARIAQLQSLLGMRRAGLAGGVSGPGTAPTFETLLADAVRASDTGALRGTSAPVAAGATTAGGASGQVTARATTGSTTDLGAAAVAKARQYTGVRYVWGGEDPATGVDCSGLVQSVFGSLGIDLPRVAADQSRAGRAVPSLEAARPGDLVFFGKPAHHVGIYVGDGKMIDAPRAGKTVGVHKLWGPPSAIRRVVPEVVATETVTSMAGASGSGSLTGPYAALFTAAGKQHGVDPALLSAVAKAESAYNPRAVSRAGAQGLMQLMPATARSLGVDPLDPTEAVDGAARLLKDLLSRFDGRVDLALAGYNAGPGAVRTHGGIPPYPETQTYVRRVMSYREALR